MSVQKPDLRLRFMSRLPCRPPVSHANTAGRPDRCSRLDLSIFADMSYRWLVNDGVVKMPDDAGVMSLVTLVEYQQGGIVSRQVVKKPAGTVTAVAFDAGEELTEHTSPFDALIQIVEGDAEITLAGRPRRVSAQQLILLPANVPHAVKAVTRFKMLLTMIRS